MAIRLPPRWRNLEWLQRQRTLSTGQSADLKWEDMDPEAGEHVRVWLERGTNLVMLEEWDWKARGGRCQWNITDRFRAERLGQRVWEDDDE